MKIVKYLLDDFDKTSDEKVYSINEHPKILCTYKKDVHV